MKNSSLLLSASSDHNTRMWRANEDGSYSSAHVLTVRLMLGCSDPTREA